MKFLKQEKENSQQANGLATKGLSDTRMKLEKNFQLAQKETLLNIKNSNKKKQKRKR